MKVLNAEGKFQSSVQNQTVVIFVIFFSASLWCVELFMRAVNFSYELINIDVFFL